MPIFDINGQRVLYVHVPKTGGSSIEEALAAHGRMSFKKSSVPDGFPCTPQHFHAQQLIDLFPSWREAFDLVFVTVRDPKSRLESEYRFRMQGLRQAFPGKPMPPFSVWSMHFLQEARKNPFVLDNHLRPQSEFILPGARVFKYEDGLASCLMEVAGLLGVRGEISLPHLNQSIGPGAGQVTWSIELEAAFLDFYARDYETLSYLQAS